MLITTAWLRNWGACGKALRVFRGLWPNGARVTKRNLVRAAAYPELRLNWLAIRIFDSVEMHRWVVLKDKAYWTMSTAKMRLCNRYRYWEERLGSSKALKKVRYKACLLKLDKDHQRRLGLAFWAVWERSLRKESERASSPRSSVLAGLSGSGKHGQ